MTATAFTSLTCSNSKNSPVKRKSKYLVLSQGQLSLISGQISLLSSAGREMSSSVADWGGGMSASCKPRVQLFADAGNGWPHSARRYH